MYDMTSIFSYEGNQVTIIALSPRGNKLEIVERGGCSMSIASTLWEKYCCAIELRRFGGVAQRRTFHRMLKKFVQQGRSR
jgi:hypothetical protein